MPDKVEKVNFGQIGPPYMGPMAKVARTSKLLPLLLTHHYHHHHRGRHPPPHHHQPCHDHHQRHSHHHHDQGELFGGQLAWSNFMGAMAEVARTCNLLPLLLAHHLALLSDPGRGVHRGCPGESPVKGSAKNTDDFQVNRKQLTLPSSLSRLALVIVHSLGPAILASALRRLEKKLEDPDLEISPAARRTLLKVLPFLQSVASGLQKLHTCLFYLQVIPKMTQKMDRIPQGSYYHLAKRLLGIEYVKRVEEDEDESGGAEKNTGPVFRLLGGVAALHLILSALQTLRKPPSSSSSSTSVPLSSSADERRTLGHRCPLCLDALGTCGVRIRSFFVS